MSQRECAGFNWPPLSIPAEEPVSISPEAVSRAGPSVITEKAATPKSLFQPFRSASFSAPSKVRVLFTPSIALVVGHPAKLACLGNWSLRSLPSRCATMPGVSFQSRTVGVTHPECSVSDVRRTDARRRERDTPEGVTHAFHVSVYKVDPSIDSLARNLLSKDDCRAALVDEVLPGGP